MSKSAKLSREIERTAAPLTLHTVAVERRTSSSQPHQTNPVTVSRSSKIEQTAFKKQQPNIEPRAHSRIRITQIKS
jgi:hypothetical protein